MTAETKQVKSIKLPLLIDHRGDQAAGPDNTRSAIGSSLKKRPVHGVNVNVRACVDGLYLAHDAVHWVQKRQMQKQEGDSKTKSLTFDSSLLQPNGQSQATEVNLDKCTMDELKQYDMVERERKVQPEPICFWTDVIQWIKDHPDKVFWIDLKDGPYRPVTKESGCYDCWFTCCLYLCGCWCPCSVETIEKELHPLVVRLVESMHRDLTADELKRCIVSSTNPFVMMEWIMYAKKYNLSSKLAGFGFDYGNQHHWLYECSMDMMVLEKQYGTNFVSMGANLMTDEKRKHYQSRDILTAVYEHFTTETIPKSASNDIYIVEHFPPKEQLGVTSKNSIL